MLGINTTMADGENSEFLPICKFGAESGRFYKIDRVGGANGFESVPTELPVGTKFAADFGGISVGWLLFSAGAAPSLALVPLGRAMPERPSKDHRQGFRMLIHLGKNGGVRELASASKTLTGAIDELHTLFEQAPEARAGKIPVVQFDGADMFTNKNQFGSKTLFKPKFSIVAWIDRPADLGERTVPPPGRSTTPGAVSGNGPAGHGAAQRPAPKAAPPPADDDWGSSTAREAGGGSIDDEIPF